MLKTKNKLNQKIKIEPKIGIIFGSGSGSFGDEIEVKVDIKYEDIPHLKNMSNWLCLKINFCQSIRC